MVTEPHEQMEADIIKAVYGDTHYSHVGNILLRLRALEAEHPIRKAVEILHAEVFGE